VKVGALGIKKEGENFDTPSFCASKHNCAGWQDERECLSCTPLTSAIYLQIVRKHLKISCYGSTPK
jgi:hypothetical protein